jgi:acetate kinase
MKILVLNSGSSSQKSALYELGAELPANAPPPLWEAKIEWRGTGAAGELTVRERGSPTMKKAVRVQSRGRATEQMLSLLASGSRPIARPGELAAVGHRIVHGGPEFRVSMPVTARVMAAIARSSEFAPLHNRAELDGIRAVARLFGNVRQIAVFDTAFHRTMPLAAEVYPGPYRWFRQGIRRYGFHGISHQYAAERAAELLAAGRRTLRLVTCHLGNGCSLAAIRGGRSVDTTMGYTPLEGLMMGTRSGSVDPGILIHLIRKRGATAADLDRMLNRRSGLAGISGFTSDMRELLAAAGKGNQRARLALEMFVHRLRAGIGAMLASLGGIDALVFTGGIGENAPEVRAAACAPFRFLGLALDPKKNARARGDQDVARPDSRVRVLVLRAQEDWAIARECWRVLLRAKGPASSAPGRA